MKRFLLFSGYTYYAAGGAFDFDADFDSLAEAQTEGERALEKKGYDWWHIYDSEKRAVVAESEIQAHH